MTVLVDQFVQDVWLRASKSMAYQDLYGPIQYRVVNLAGTQKFIYFSDVIRGPHGDMFHIVTENKDADPEVTQKITVSRQALAAIVCFALPEIMSEDRLNALINSDI